MSATLTTFRYRLMPTGSEERELVRAVGATRWVFNQLLRYREDCWLAARSAGATGIAVGLGYVHLTAMITTLRGERPWLARQPVVILRGAAKALDRAFQNFFDGRGGFPRYKKRGELDAINIPDTGGIRVADDRVKLPKLGWVRFHRHRDMQGAIRALSITREGGKWYICFACQGTYSLPREDGEAVGIDLGVAASVTVSDGRAPILFPVATRAEHARLKRLQRQVARRKKGSNRRRRTVARIAAIRRRLARRRTDAAHKASHQLATRHRLIVVEKLNLKAMTKSAAGTKENPGTNVAAKAGLNRVLTEQGHGDFLRMLTYKCERSGARLVQVDPRYTSQTCSQCGHCAPENRETQANFRCVACGHHSNADLNAALNILAAGQAVIAQGGAGVAPAHELRSDRRKRIKKAP